MASQSASQGLENHHDVEARAAETARVFGDQGADDAQFGQRLVGSGVESGLGFGRFVARFDGIFVFQEAIQAVLKHPAVFGMLEIHLVFLRVRAAFGPVQAS